LERYFEEDVHFSSAKSKQRVPRFLFNDLTRYWRTICVDYAAKHRKQVGKQWAIRNAKLRFSRKLLFASGLAFCLSCELDPPNSIHNTLFGVSLDESSGPFITKARAFARTPALEFLAAFVDEFVQEPQKRATIATNIFGSYDWWLVKMNDTNTRETLKNLNHGDAMKNGLFQDIRNRGGEFAKGLELLFFNRSHEQEQDKVAKLTLQYIGF